MTPTVAASNGGRRHTGPTTIDLTRNKQPEPPTKRKPAMTTETTNDGTKSELEALRKALFGEKRRQPATNQIPHPQPKKDHR